MTIPTWQPGQFVTSERHAEQMAAAALRGMGYPDARETPVGPDGGVDVRARAAIAQVKWRGAQSGRSDLQRLVGARGLDHHLALFFFVGTGYSAHALVYAAEMGIACFVFDSTGRLLPMSPAARAALASTTQSKPTPPAAAPAPSRWRLWWKRWWLEVITVFAWIGAPVMAISALQGDPDGSWGGAAFYLIVALVGTAALRRRRRR